MKYRVKNNVAFSFTFLFTDILKKKKKNPSLAKTKLYLISSLIVLHCGVDALIPALDS